MPTYLYACQGECGQDFESWKLISERNITPIHCGVESKRIMNAPMVAPLFESYRAVGLPGKPWIRTKTEHRSKLREHGKEEVGNDASVAPPKMSDAEFSYQQGEQLKEIQQTIKQQQQLEKFLSE